jgi:hypothetical protein
LTIPDPVIGASVIWFTALWIILMFRYRGMPGRGGAWIERDKHPRVFLFCVGFVAFVGAVAGFGFLLS